MSAFFQQVFSVVAEIPYGKVLSYGQIAHYLGCPQSSRMVGWAMHTCPPGLPWHRVIKKSGELAFPKDTSAYQTQYRLLKKEGVELLPNGKVDMHRYEWEITLSE